MCSNTWSLPRDRQTDDLQRRFHAEAQTSYTPDISSMDSSDPGPWAVHGI